MTHCVQTDWQSHEKEAEMAKAAGENAAPVWVVGWSVQTCTEAAARSPGIVQVAWSASGAWLYAASADGAVHAIEVRE